MISEQLARALAQNAAQALGLLAALGFIFGITRWRKALRKDYLLSFLVFLFGTAVSQAPVMIAGMTGWGVDMILLSAAGRLTQDIGAVLFIRACLAGVCADWIWKAIVLGAAVLVLVT